MNRRVSLNGSDWLFKEFCGEDRWISHKMDLTAHLALSEHLPSRRGRSGLLPTSAGAVEGNDHRAVDPNQFGVLP